MKSKPRPASACGRTPALALAIIAVVSLSAALADELELLNGTSMSGDVIEKTDTEVVFKAKIGEGSATVRMPISKVHALTVGDERTEFNPLPPGVRPAGGAEGAAAPGADPRDTRTRQEVMALIQEAGRTEPDWWASTPLNYPDTLNLSWQQVREGWAPQYNLGAYMYTAIVEHPERWKEGVKLLHRALEVNRSRNDRRAIDTTLRNLADRYRNLLQDYARSAYWNQYAGICDAAGLAECYWKLGNTTMAIELLRTVGVDRTRTGRIIKLWGEIGELQQALALADDAVRGNFPDTAYLAAGDACRYHGQYDWAMQCYQKVVQMTRGGRDIKASQARARESLQCLRGIQNVDLSSIPDGTYRGRAEAGFKGPLEIDVTVRSGRIESVRIAQHRENWFLASIDYVPQKIVEEQGIKGVDAVTGATTTSRAIINATAAALVSAGQQ
jgi:uncharacterized protein with FMN-binding domain